MESHVVCINRRTESDPQHVVGLIERVQEGQQQRFSSMEELWKIFAAKQTAKASRSEAARLRTDIDAAGAHLPSSATPAVGKVA